MIWIAVSPINCLDMMNYSDNAITVFAVQCKYWICSPQGHAAVPVLSHDHIFVWHLVLYSQILHFFFKHSPFHSELINFSIYSCSQHQCLHQHFIAFFITKFCLFFLFCAYTISYFCPLGRFNIRVPYSLREKCIVTFFSDFLTLMQERTH